MLQITDSGLHCPAGDFYIDPWRPVRRAVVTHAHADHARAGSKQYLTTTEGKAVLARRIGGFGPIQAVGYGERLRFGDVSVSLHPAGHILGSAQVRMEHHGEVWVVSGDYKTAPDPTCTLFEPVRCHLFVTESTFGLPIFRWPEERAVFAEINAWWAANRAAGRASLLYAYSLGKAQRLLAGIDASIGPIWAHGAILKLNEDYRASGVALPPTFHPPNAPSKVAELAPLVLAPPGTHGTPWMRRFADAATAFASGWMMLRGTRQRRAVDRGFVVSDHADWPGLLGAIEATGAERVWVTHGYRDALLRWLGERGLEATSLATRFEGEGEVSEEVEEALAAVAESEATSPSA
jgi:putative mRNA 3-end processing factor